MNLGRLLGCLLVGWLTLSTTTYGQLNPVRTAWNRLQDKQWERSFRTLKKELAKDTAHVEANYVLAAWYLSPANPERQVDSAHHYILKTEKLFQTLSDRDQERVQRFPIDSIILSQLHDRIDSTAFSRAKSFNTEVAYLFFIEHYPNAAEIENAIELRDEVSFLEALKVNTYQSFQEYLTRYPDSHRAGEAKDRYERLLFEDKTRDKKMESYKAFFRSYPGSPYALQAEQQIFELSTASGDPEGFLNYLHQYPQGHYATFARNLLFHLVPELDEELPEQLLTDSLRRVTQLNAHYWIPFYKDGLFGFMNSEGAEVLSAQFQEVEDEYKCYPIRSDILKLNSGSYSRSGKKLAEPETELMSIGYGFLKSKSKECIQLIHKSGLVLVPGCHSEFKMVGTNFLAGEKGKEWTLFTLTGRPLPLKGIEQVREVEGLIEVTRSGKKILTTLQNLTEIVQGGDLHDELVFDEVRPVRAGQVLVRNGSMEGILDRDLNYVVPLYRQSLTLTPFGLIVRQPTGSRVQGLSTDLENKIWSAVTFQGEWLVLESEGKLQLYHVASKKMTSTLADSIWFDRSLALAQIASTTRVYLSANRSIELLPDSKVLFISARDSVQFWYTENKGKRTVFNLNGDLQFTTEYDLVESIGMELFLVSKGNLKGVLGRNGKEVIRVEMDAIIINPDGQLSLLKNRQFGLFDPITRKLVKPVFERNLVLLDKDHLIAFKNGQYGIVGWDSKAFTNFEFSEIVPWSDSLIWVKRNFQWQLYNYKTGATQLDQVRDFSWIRNIPEEKIVRIHQGNYYGIVSSRHHVVIQPTFHDIVNLGTPEIPLYFTEKRVEEAGIYVVIYYNRAGKLIRRQALEEEEYDRIYCDE